MSASYVWYSVVIIALWSFWLGQQLHVLADSCGRLSVDSASAPLIHEPASGPADELIQNPYLAQTTVDVCVCVCVCARTADGAYTAW